MNRWEQIDRNIYSEEKQIDRDLAVCSRLTNIETNKERFSGLCAHDFCQMDFLFRLLKSLYKYSTNSRRVVGNTTAAGRFVSRQLAHRFKAVPSFPVGLFCTVVTNIELFTAVSIVNKIPLTRLQLKIACRWTTDSTSQCTFPHPSPADNHSTFASHYTRFVHQSVKMVFASLFCVFVVTNW